MAVEISFRGEKYIVEPGMTIREAIERLDIVPESVIPVREGELIPEDYVLKDGESLKLIPVISGGSPGFSTSSTFLFD